MRIFSLILVLCGQFLVNPDLRGSTVCPSGCDFTSIKEASDNTPGGEVIIMEAGIYYETGIDLAFGSSTATAIRSIDPQSKQAFIIDGGGSADTVLTLGSGTLSGVTIQNAGVAIEARGPSAVVTDCVIRNNSLGGIGGNSGSLSLTIERCEFLDNDRGPGLNADGGGLVIQGASLTIRDSLFKGNSASHGGGVFTLALANDIQNTRFLDNVSAATQARGGGMVIGGGQTAARSALLRNLSFIGNEARGDNVAEGGGMHIAAHVSVDAQGLAFQSNKALQGGMPSSNSRGGGLYVLAFSDAIENLDVTASGNTAGQGSGVACGFPQVESLSGVISGNSPDPQIVGCDDCSFGQTRACDTGLAGVCATGIQRCTLHGTWGQCGANQNPLGIIELVQAEEDCSDGIDNDCDGDTDGADAQCRCVPNANKGTGQDCDPRTQAENREGGEARDPVNTFLGELYQDYPADIDLGGPLPLRFARYYASGLSQAGISGNLGSNWRHNFEWSLTDLGTRVEIVSDTGRRIPFNDDGSTWVLDGQTDVAYQLVSEGPNFVLGHPSDFLIYVFNAGGQLIEIQDLQGNTHSLSYMGDLLSAVSDGLGRQLSFTYSGDRLTGVSDGTRNVAFTQNLDDLASVTDTRGHTTQFSYAPGGLMTEMIQPMGNRPYTQTWNAQNRVATQTDAEGNTHGFDYNDITGETTLTDPNGDVRVHEHSGWGGNVRRQDQLGENVDNAFDADGRAAALVDRVGDVTRFEYDSLSGQLYKLAHADGTASLYGYAQVTVRGITFSKLATVLQPDGGMANLTYDATGNLVSVLDPAGERWTLTHNSRGQVLTVKSPSGGLTSRSYNPDATLAASTDPAGNTTTYEYDGLRRLVLIRHADDTTLTLSHDNADRLLSVTNENGDTTTLTYDANGNLATVQDPLLKTTTLAYDDMDRLSSITDPEGGVHATSYDALERIATTTNPNGNTTAFAYDERGRMVALTDPLGRTWSLDYDLEGILTSSSDPLGNTTTHASDTMGRITQTTSSLGHVGSVDHDPVGRVVSSTDGLNRTTRFQYDTRGHLIASSLPDDTITARFQRSNVGRVAAITDPNGNDWTRSYDASHRLTELTDPLGQTRTVGYDDRNRPEVVTFPAGMGSVAYAYDDAGNRIEADYSDGTLLGYRYDANQRLIAANDGGASPDNVERGYDDNGRIASSNGIVITRDPSGRITAMELVSGKVVTYAYDANDRLISVSDWLGGTLSFSYDDAGRLTGISRPNGVNTTQTWDNDSRLVGIEESGASSIALSRDAAGQITSATRDLPLMITEAGVESYAHAFDAAAQIDGDVHDGLGRRTESGADGFTWDLASRLTGYTVDGVPVSNTYDALGRRIGRTAGAIAQSFVWNDALALPSIAVESRNGGEYRYYVHTPDGRLLFSVDPDDSRHFYHYDEMGNTQFVTDDDGAVIASYRYTPFGQLRAKSGTFDNPFTWQGQNGLMDEGNGLYYVRARYYDSRSGRFISRDPIRLLSPRAANPYQYAFNNPLGFVDADGMKPHPARAAAAAGLGAQTVALRDVVVARYPSISGIQHRNLANAINFAWGAVRRGNDSTAAIFLEEASRMLEEIRETGNQAVLGDALRTFIGSGLSRKNANRKSKATSPAEPPWQKEKPKEIQEPQEELEFRFEFDWEYEIDESEKIDSVIPQLTPIIVPT